MGSFTLNANEWEERERDQRAFSVLERERERESYGMEGEGGEERVSLLGVVVSSANN